jgi:hypothetical protein
MNYQVRQLPFGRARGGSLTTRKINPAVTVYRTNRNAGGPLTPSTPAKPAPFVPRRQRLALDAQMTQFRVNIAGNVFWVTSASGTDAIAQVQFVQGSNVSDVVDIAQGFRMFGVEFDYVLITTAAAQAAKYLTITYGDDPTSRGVEGDTI